MENLDAAKAAWEEAQKELDRHRAAFSAAVGDRKTKEGQRLNVREKMRDAAIEIYLGSDQHSEKDIQEYSDQIRALEDGIAAADLAERRVENSTIPLLEQKVESSKGSYERLKALVGDYNRTKKLYAEYYRQGALDEANRQAFSNTESVAFREVKRLRPRLEEWAERLGCEQDFAAFLAGVEGESEE